MEVCRYKRVGMFIAPHGRCCTPSNNYCTNSGVSNSGRSPARKKQRFHAFWHVCKYNDEFAELYVADLIAGLGSQVYVGDLFAAQLENFDEVVAGGDDLGAVTGIQKLSLRFMDLTVS